MPDITVWTKQNEAVLKQLEENGRFIADVQFIRKELEDTADIMLFIYDWLAGHVQIAGERPADVKYPVWVSFTREAAMMPEPGYVLLRIETDIRNILAIDIEKWTMITNYSYIPASSGDACSHNRMMREMGIDNARAVMTQFYPEIRSKIIESWERLFEPPATAGSSSYGLIWEVKREWIREIIQ